MAEYSTVSVSGYNSSPPSDDGAQTSANSVTWAKHKTKIGDPLKTAIESIDTALVSRFAQTPITVQTAAETAAGASIYSAIYFELDPRRYGENTTPLTTDCYTMLQTALDVAKARGGGVVPIDDQYRTDTGLIAYGGTKMQGTGIDHFLGSFTGISGSLIQAGAAMDDLITTAVNDSFSNAVGVRMADFCADGNNLATDVLSLETALDYLRGMRVTRGLSVGIHEDTSGVAVHTIVDTRVTMDSVGIGIHTENGSDSNYVNVNVAGAADAQWRFESGGHVITNMHLAASPIDPDDESLITHLDIKGTSKLTFIGGNIDQLYYSTHPQVWIRTTSTSGCLRIDFIGTKFNNPNCDIDTTRAVLMDASVGTNKWINANFTGCIFSGNDSHPYAYIFEKEATHPTQIIYRVNGGYANNATAQFSHYPDSLAGFDWLTGGFSQVAGGHSIINQGYFALGAGTEVTISSGEVLITGSRHRVDTESDDAQDDLETISMADGSTPPDGMMLELRVPSSNRNVTLKHAVDNIYLNGGDDEYLGVSTDVVILCYDSASAKWRQWGGSTNAGMQLGIPTATAANIADMTSFQNTDGKLEGKLIWDTTNQRLLRASGSGATDDWDVVDGSASVTPS